MTATDATASTAATTPTVGSDEDATNRLFSTTMLISAVRCTLAYVVFPWLLPLVGVTKNMGPGLGLAIGAVAIAFNVLSIRRFHASDHHWKWPVTALNVTVIVLLSILAVEDLLELF